MFSAACLNIQGDTLVGLVYPVTSLVIPEGIVHIADCAFRDESCLRDVTFPDSLVSIGAKAFENCRSLESIYLSGKSNLEIIGNGAFH